MSLNNETGKNNNCRTPKQEVCKKNGNFHSLSVSVVTVLLESAQQQFGKWFSRNRKDISLVQCWNFIHKLVNHIVLHLIIAP